MSAAAEFLKFLLERREGKPDKYLIAMGATADHFGWSEHFPIWAPKPWAFKDGRQFCKDPGRRGDVRTEAGCTLRISRSPCKNGFPKGLVHRFKVSNNCTLWDIAEVAHFSQGDWYWMTGPTGERIDRVHWESRYASTEPRRRGGLVSA